MPGRNLAVLLDNAGQGEDRDRAARVALAIDPFHPAAFLAEARRRLERGEGRQALADLDRLIAARPDLASAHAMRARVLDRLGRRSEALSASNRALALEPNKPQHLMERGLLLSADRRMEEAAASWAGLLLIEPGNADAWSNLGVSERNAGRTGIAAHLLGRATAIGPDHAEAWCNRGITEVEAGRHRQAIDCFRRALAIRPDYPDADLALGMALLAVGETKAGLASYEARLASAATGIADKGPALPRWTGDALAGRSIIIMAEQGFGDAFHFSRYVRALKARGAGVVAIGCRKPLVGMMRTVPGIDLVVAEGETLPRFDCMAYMMSLPYLLFGDLDPQREACPRSEQTPVAFPLAGLAGRPAGLKVGLAWQGNPDPKVDKGRSFRLADADALSGVEGVTYVSLQRGDGPRAARSLRPGAPDRDPARRLRRG